MNTKLNSIYVYLYSRAYQTIMKISHKYNWHYAPTNYVVDPTTNQVDTQFWCQWCGLKYTVNGEVKSAESAYDSLDKCFSKIEQDLEPYKDKIDACLQESNEKEVK